MSAFIWIYLLIAGVLAGLLSTMAGLASLVSYPVLLSVGLPPISANVTNTTSAVFTGIGALFSSKRELTAQPKITLSVISLTLIGGICGSLLLVVQPASTFEHLVPFLIFGASCLMLVPKKASSKQAVTINVSQSRLMLIIKGIAIFLVGIYTGYFGASAGMILLAVLNVTIDQPFAINNAIKNLAILASNFIAMVIYAFTAQINWADAIVMGIGFFIGGYLGPILVHHVSTKWLRIFIAIGAFALSGYFFYTTYF